MNYTDDPRWETIPEGIRQHLHTKESHYVRKMLDTYGGKIEQEEQPAPVVQQAKPKPKGKSKRGANLIGGARPPVFDYKEIARLWSEGMLVKDIMVKVGCSQATVSKALRKMQPEGYTGKSGPRTRTHCSNNHDLSVYGKPATGGGRFCSECRRAYQRVAWKRRNEVAS